MNLSLSLYFDPHEQDTPPALAVGTRVCCTYRGEHRGTVVAIDDPRAWANTLQFPTPTPDPDAVRAHVVKVGGARALTARGEVPVLWDFGRVYWDRLVFAVDAMELVS